MDTIYNTAKQRQLTFWLISYRNTHMQARAPLYPHTQRELRVLHIILYPVFFT